MSTHNLCFEQKYEKYQNFYLKIFLFFFGCKIFNIFESACFRNAARQTHTFWSDIYTSEMEKCLGIVYA